MCRGLTIGAIIGAGFGGAGVYLFTQSISLPAFIILLWNICISHLDRARWKSNARIAAWSSTKGNTALIDSSWKLDSGTELLVQSCLCTSQLHRSHSWPYHMAFVRICPVWSGRTQIWQHLSVLCMPSQERWWHCVGWLGFQILMLLVGRRDSTTECKVSRFGLPSLNKIRRFDNHIVEFDTRTKTPHWVLEHITKDSPRIGDRWCAPNAHEASIENPLKIAFAPRLGKKMQAWTRSHRGLLWWTFPHMR